MLGVISRRFAAVIGQPGVVVYEKRRYGVFEALNPFFEVVLRGLSCLVDGEHYFDTIADGAIFESRTKHGVE